MIYSINESTNTYIEAVALFGKDADEFLESVEVALYEDTVAIGENVYDGADAEEFLAENGIFLYEDHIVLEGQQAEEYKARKEHEKNTQKLLDHMNAGGRAISGNKAMHDYRTRTMDRMSKNMDDAMDGKKLNIRKFYMDTLKDRYSKETRAGVKQMKDEYNATAKKLGIKGKDKYDNDNAVKIHNTSSSIKRHNRRHPDDPVKLGESTIFDFDLK